MKIRIQMARFFCTVLLSCCFTILCAHDIYFCGERIPIENKAVADKLMSFIKKSANYVNIPSLKKSIDQYMTEVEEFLKAANLPQDLKYLAIVESGFRTDVSSQVGAAGFWQLMPATARELNLTVNGVVDERKYFHESSVAACKLLAGYYMDIRRKFGVSSWVLTAAAYNNGIGNIQNAIRKQGPNYFQMQLNEETAAYVYKIIAIKELFEYPELYMKDFGYNIFSDAAAKVKNPANKGGKDDTKFGGMTVNVDISDGEHPDDLNKKIKPVKKDDKNINARFIEARIKGKYKKFNDGDLVSLTIEADLQVGNRFNIKGSVLKGRGWIIDDRVRIDLGYGRNVILLDKKKEKGVALKALKNKQKIILEITE